MNSILDAGAGKLNQTTKRVAGTEHQYLLDGVTAVPIVASFFAPHEVAEAEGETTFAGVAPVLGVDRSDLPRDPRQGDKVIRKDGSVYRVYDIEPDGTGWFDCLLELEKEGVPNG